MHSISKHFTGGWVARSFLLADRLTMGLGSSEEGWLLAAITSRAPIRISNNSEKLAFSRFGTTFVEVSCYLGDVS